MYTVEPLNTNGHGWDEYFIHCSFLEGIGTYILFIVVRLSSHWDVQYWRVDSSLYCAYLKYCIYVQGHIYP